MEEIFKKLEDEMRKKINEERTEKMSKLHDDLLISMNKSELPVEDIHFILVILERKMIDLSMQRYVPEEV